MLLQCMCKEIDSEWDIKYSSFPSALLGFFHFMEVLVYILYESVYLMHANV